MADDDEPGGRGSQRTRRCSAGGQGLLRQEFSEFYVAEAKALVNFVIRLGASPHDAADAAQTALAMLYEAWHTVTHPRAWVRTVAKRSYLRSAPSTAAEITTDTVPELPTPLLSPPDYAEVLESTRDLVDLLNQLPFRQRMIMSWRMDGFNDTEIARELQTTRTAVSTEAGRARATLKHILAARYEGVN